MEGPAKGLSTIACSRVARQRITNQHGRAEGTEAVDDLQLAPDRHDTKTNTVPRQARIGRSSGTICTCTPAGRSRSAGEGCAHYIDGEQATPNIRRCALLAAM